MLSAVATSGIVFSFLGFRQAVELAGETSNPRRHIRIAVIGSVLISTALYALLEVAMIYGVTPADFAHGWGSLHLTGIAGLAGVAGLT